MNGFPTFPYGVSFAGYWDASVGYFPPAPSSDSFWIVLNAGDINSILFEAGSCIKYVRGAFSKDDGFMMNWQVIANKPETAERWPKWDEVEGKPVGTELESTIAIRDSEGDLAAHRFKSNAYSQSVIPPVASLAFRVNPNDDSFIRFGSRSAVVNWLGQVLDSAKLEGKTIDDITKLARQNVVLNDVTINKKPLTGPLELNAADIGLGNVPNYEATSAYNGTATSLLATQKAVYDAAGAPLLADERKRKITMSTIAPQGSDGVDGDIWLVY